MESIFKRKVQAVHMDELFETLNIRYYEPVTPITNDEFKETNVYEYNIRLRHNEETNGEEIFDTAHKQLSL